MHPYALVYPMLALVLLSAIVLASMFAARVRAVKAKEVSTKYFRIYQGETEPEQAAKRARHFTNLFEAPVLFYAACLAAMVTQAGGLAMHVLAWAYVAARVIHALVHIGRNRLRPRMAVYFVGWLVLLAMWIVLAVSVARSAA